jgi:hypothetical protein
MFDISAQASNRTIVELKCFMADKCAGDLNAIHRNSTVLIFLFGRSIFQFVINKKNEHILKT